MDGGARLRPPTAPPPLFLLVFGGASELLSTVSLTKVGTGVAFESGVLPTASGGCIDGEAPFLMESVELDWEAAGTTSPTILASASGVSCRVTIFFCFGGMVDGGPRWWVMDGGWLGGAARSLR